MVDVGVDIDVMIGVDTHVGSHTAAVVAAGTGAVLEVITVDATAAGYEELVDFADRYAVLRAWAIEGTGIHGAGLNRVLAARGEQVIELDRPERTPRRGGVKTDADDAVRAAREALSRGRNGTPRAGGDRAALSVLMVARRSAVAAAGTAKRQLFSLVIAAPEAIRVKFKGATGTQLATIAAGLRQSAGYDTETAATVESMRSLATRIKAAQAEAKTLEKKITAIVTSWRPDLLEQLGVGALTAAVVLCAWSHPGRIHSEAAFAKLAGVAPIPANSGQVQTRYRLSRYGDRQLNRALHVIVITRQRSHPATMAFTTRRTTEGKTPREIRRCLKRYIARDLYRLLENPHPEPLDQT